MTADNIITCGTFHRENPSGYIVSMIYQQSRECLPGRLLYIFAAFSTSLSVLTLSVIALALCYDLFVRKKAINSAAISSYLLGILGAVGMVIITTTDFTGNPYQNSIGWFSAYVGICVMEVFTAIHWSTVSLNLMDVRLLLDGTEQQQSMNDELRRLRSALMRWTTLEFVLQLAVLLVRAGLHDINNPVKYNIGTAAQALWIMPWFAYFAYTVSHFAHRLADTLESTIFDLTKLTPCTESNIKTSWMMKSRMMSTQITSTNTANTVLPDSVQEKVDKIRSYCRKIRLIGNLISLDKTAFVLVYTIYLVNSFLEIYGKRPPAMWYVIGIHFVVIPAANAVLWLCTGYHAFVSTVGGNAGKASRNTSSKGTGNKKASESA